MRSTPGIFLTGATGLLGRYLLRDLLASGHRVGVLIRNENHHPAADRLDELHAFACESLGRRLRRPVLLQGDLTAPRLGLGLAERHWLARTVDTVIHSAAQVAHRETPEGEPWETNVNGTLRLLKLCRALGIAEFHHLSTAFVSGDRRGIVYEDELDCGSGCGNVYKRSKFTSERMVCNCQGLRATIYRPSIIVGDSRTGYTSTYHHFYRFLELAVRLSSRPGSSKAESGPLRQKLELRLPVGGEERQNFVPVDWVARAICELLHRPQCHGRTYHLVSWSPVRMREITNLIEDVLRIEGLQCVGPDGPADPTSLEKMILEQFDDYWSYLRKDVVFDSRNTRQALPHLPPPAFDRELVKRLLNYAQADCWGRERSHSKPTPASEIAYYLESVLPDQLRKSRVARALPRGLHFAIDINGPGGGQWACCCGDGTIRVERGLDSDTLLTYRMDAPTFEDLIRGRQTTRQAFFDGRIEIAGDTEKALMLAMLLEDFLDERQHHPAYKTETFHAVAGN